MRVPFERTSSGVLRRYLLEHGGLPSRSLTAAVPISLREEGNTDANNQVFGMICSLATNIEDPKERLEAIIAQSAKSKEMSHPLRALMPSVSNVAMLGAPMLIQVLALLYSRSNLSDVLPPTANVTISNVPGPRQTLYAVGAELLHIFPVSISTWGAASSAVRTNPSTRETMWATRVSSSSPVAWPSVSLISLKRSRSMNISAPSRCERALATSACCSRSFIKRRLGSSVSGS